MIESRANQYWLRKLSFDQPTASIPVEYDAGNGSSTGVYSFTFTQEQNQLLQAFAGGLVLKWQIIFTAATALLLHRYTGLPLIRMATPVDQSDDPATQGILIPLELDIANAASFRHLLQTTRDLLVEGLFHQQYDAAVLQEKMNSNGQHPLYEVVTVFTNIQGRVEELFPGNNLLLSFTYEPTGCTGQLLYNQHDYSELYISDIVNNLLNYLVAVLQHPDEPLDSVLSATPVTWPDTIGAVEALFTEQFQAVVKANPEKIAVVKGTHAMTYETIDQRSGQLARYLLQHTSGAKARIAICMHNSVETVLSILGILKAGFTFVPIDSSLPAERIAFILQDSAPEIMLTSGVLNNHAFPAGLKVTDLADLSLLDEYETGRPGIGISPTDACYIMYTSGTSGAPKGVIVTHASLMNYLRWAAAQYTGNGQQLSSFAFFTSISFDLTITSILVPLIAAGSVNSYTGQEPADMLATILADNKTGVLKLTPSHLRLLAAVLKERTDIQPQHSLIHTFIVGGETLHTALAQEIAGYFPQAAIYNEYGPTEATVGCMIHRYSPEDDRYAAVPIGKPISNTHLFLLDEKGKTVPDGATGELYVGGACLSQGYLNNEELTALKFVCPVKGSSATYYRTGDLAKKLPGGLYSYIGRKDTQVKINGYRIEPGEIENYARKHPAISDTTVICKMDNAQSPLIILYYVADQALPEAVITGFLAGFLPAYMMPHQLIAVPAIPLNANGKADTRLLPGAPASKQAIDLPVTDTEKKLHAIWKKHLTTEQFGINDNFYTLGGDSIKSLGLMNEINKAFGINLQIRDLYVLKTIRNLADHLTQRYGPALAQTMTTTATPKETEKDLIADEISRLKQEILDNM
ncbi:amino acid adenylation domain-containing protein [Paraflavitalea soli]|uniref:Amino acid adenylation domain-containing protein n=1 Tax=Paraflavitalea soli TaxID=2315862 RepID=A0A3B7MT69_9BACT|nr:non-ribosomal peptide synthetase [Paraflavitalea soli]AXY73691.1 amino acid adenylation domain-containing protein [Paraflavitalea soli]